jgi:RNA polymerase sigma-70 factor (ECF subfamily)
VALVELLSVVLFRQLGHADGRIRDAVREGPTDAAYDLSFGRHAGDADERSGRMPQTDQMLALALRERLEALGLARERSTRSSLRVSSLRALGCRGVRGRGGHDAVGLRHERYVTRLETRSDERLLQERRPGVAGPAFAVLYRRYEALVLAYFRRRTRSPDVAADLAAETFAQALESRWRFRAVGSDGSAAAWLFGIAGHVHSRSVRRGRVEDRGRRKLGLPPLVLEDDALRLVAEADTDQAILKALERLPEDQRAAVRDRIIEEQDYPEIALRLSCSEAVVRKRVSRGLASLRRDLEELA